MKNLNLKESITQASRVIGSTWPLYSFVTSNPLSGYEDLSFSKALTRAEELLNANVYPEADVLKYAYKNGLIKRRILASQLKESGIKKKPEECLEILDTAIEKKRTNTFHELDRQMSKWLSGFTDEGLAEWPMPFKEEGFYKAWRKLVKYDSTIKDKIYEIPDNSELAIEQTLKRYPERDHLRILINHLAALPGWTGYINYRTQNDTEWNKKYPLSLADYLGVRFMISNALDLNLIESNKENERPEEWRKINLAFLKSWELSFQSTLVRDLKKQPTKQVKSKRPEAQFVFCIDTRSEQIRRHVEATGNYETFGYAGFFGIAMDYEDEAKGVLRKSCPPIVPSAYRVREAVGAKGERDFLKRKKRLKQRKFRKYFLNRMKNMLPSAFGYVEASGIAYGCALLGRTISPGLLYRRKKASENNHETFCKTEMYSGTGKLAQIPLDEKASILKNAFHLLGWQKFAPLVVFAGHGSHSANNAFGSSLDCGACAASPGRHNARMLARIANMPEVRKILALVHKIKIPQDTFFMAAEHNTTTDEILLFESEVPVSHEIMVRNLKSDLKIIQENATYTRLKFGKSSISKAETKANDWSETRPEWGLARNAGFIIAPRSLTTQHDLKSRCFLHSYDWKEDENGSALETIMQGPMVVTQWINNHYYFSTVDNDKFGGSSKIFHNITGRFGVVEGNGGDLKMGLPLQSLKETDNQMYHEPLRLSVLIQAPLNRVEMILERNKNIKNLIENEWIHLLVMEPLKNNRVFRYSPNHNWLEHEEYMNEPDLVFTPELELAR